MRATHKWSDDTATICVEGLNQTVRMLHVTDSHIALIDDRDAEHIEACQGRASVLNREIRSLTN